jgi:hypothetical protein
MLAAVSIRTRLGPLRIIGMSKNFLIPVFALAVLAIGCGSGSTDGTGKTGAAGSTGGEAAGSGGSTAGSGGGAGAGGATAPDCAMQPPACTTDVFSASTFCTYLLCFCGNASAGYTTMDECLATYGGLGSTNPYKQMCESYHLCNATNDTGADRTYHCGHAVGGGPCAF